MLNQSFQLYCLERESDKVYTVDGMRRKVTAEQVAWEEFKRPLARMKRFKSAHIRYVNSLSREEYRKKKHDARMFEQNEACAMVNSILWELEKMGKTVDWYVPMTVEEAEAELDKFWAIEEML